ncbi:MAG TPA: hypothetical protein VK105_20260 [Virgibacillus sp.]|nr:hypothetical protein [Virgibacillus sp.]HLR69427.1 hypothetical protein [Virgibacillus sp.]
MKPPMPHEVTAHMPILDEQGNPITDKYGKPKTEEKKSEARVQFKSQLVRTADGREHQVNLEIDLPPSFNPGEGQEVEGKDAGGNPFKGTIKAKEDIISLMGSKVHYRTVFVDG